MISIPIQAESDDDAIRVANEQAASVHNPDGAEAGHVELAGKTHDGRLAIDPFVYSDALFRRHVQSSWKP